MILDAPEVEIGGKRYSDEWRENLRRQGKDSHDVAYQCLANWKVFSEDVDDESDGVDGESDGIDDESNEGVDDELDDGMEQ
jgi:hypothetical protein